MTEQRNRGLTPFIVRGELLSQMCRLGGLVALAMLSPPSLAQELEFQQNAIQPLKKHYAKFDPLFAQTRPVCFGRFVIDLPATTKVSWGGVTIEHSISVYPDQGHRIRAQIEAKEKEIKSDKHMSRPSTFIGTFDSSNPDSKIVIGYEDGLSISRVQLYSFIRLGKHAFVQHSKASVLERLDNGKYDASSYQQYVTQMRDIAQRLRLRDESEIPTEPGICLELGFVRLEDGRYHERTSIGFSFPEYPDVRFSISTAMTDEVNPKRGLDFIMKEGAAELRGSGLAGWFSRIRTLNEGEKQIGPWKGYQALLRVPGENRGDPSTHEFKFKFIGAANDIFRPFVDIELSTGVSNDTKGVTEPSLKNEEVMALWERLTANIRIRPTTLQTGKAP